MKIYRTLLVFTLLLFSFGCGSKTDQFRSDLKKMHLEGKVKTIRVNSYGTMSDGTVVTKTPGDNAENEKDRIITFNEAGFITSVVEYLGEEEHSITTFEYNPDNSKSVKKVEWKDGTHTAQTNFTYDAEGRVVEIKTSSMYNFDQNGPQTAVNIYKTVEFDKNGNAAKQEIWRDDTLRSISTIQYNQWHDITELVISDAKGSSKSQWLIEYDKKGNKLGEKNIYGETTMEGNRYVYDDKGLVISFTNSITRNTWTYSYTFDEKGNWIEQKQSTNGGVVYLIKRTIEYY